MIVHAWAAFQPLTLLLLKPPKADTIFMCLQTLYTAHMLADPSAALCTGLSSLLL